MRVLWFCPRKTLDISGKQGDREMMRHLLMPEWAVPGSANRGARVRVGYGGVCAND